MTEHLPECFNTAHMTAVDVPCICDRLRACESRIRSGYADTYAEGIAAGLDAALEAVEGASSLLQPLGPALSAIDALREKNPLCQ